jgi:hypothetical protein
MAEEKWKLAPWIAWALGTLGVFALLEWRGLRREGDEHPPLTHVIRRYVPAWLFFAGFGGFAVWFLFHIGGMA